MRCWACSRAIELPDLVTELPIVGALVHIGCYERETGQRPLRVRTLTQALFRWFLGDRPSRSRSESAAVFSA
jgi:hypothetical protein